MTTVQSNRRDFIKSSGVAAGSLLVGISLPTVSRLADAAALATPSTAVTAFVKVAADNQITLIIPKSEMGQGVFTGLAQVVADELEVDWNTLTVESAPVAEVYNAPFAPMQYTGGSSSIAGSFAAMRKAGATARLLLIQAAADTWAVPVSELYAEHGNVVHAPSGRRLPFGALAARAATLPVPKDPVLKEPSQWRYIGKPMPRVDSRLKSTGKAGFGLDVRLPNLHYAVIARAPTFGGRVASLDSSAAKAVPGVVRIKEVPSGVAVIAKNTWAAMQGRKALTVQWQDGPGTTFSSNQLAKDYAEKSKQPGVVVYTQGDPSITATGQHLEADYATPYLAHAPMEPLNCAVEFNAAGCDVYTGTQFQTGDRAAAAMVAGLSPDQVRIHTTYLGGGFGRRANPASDFVREAVAVAKDFGAPVMTVWSREDDIHGGYYRPQAHNRLTATLAADGKPLIWTHTQAVQSLTKGTALEKLSVDPKTGIERIQHEGASTVPYQIPNVQVSVHDGKAPVPVLWWRSVGHSNTAFAVESFIDECAYAAGVDSVMYRTALLAEHPRHLATLKLAADKAQWGRKLPAGRARGVAIHESFNSVVAQIAEVSLVDGKPHVHRVVAAVHCGTAVNPSLIESQIESAICFGLSAALFGEITLEQGRVQQSNFNDYSPVRITDMPTVEVHIVPSTDYPTGIGEPGTPPIAPAVANALFSLTGIRARRLPLSHTSFTPTKPA